MIKKSILSINNVCLTYNNSNKTIIQALENISFKVKEGEITCIVGPSGCGKSTLLYLISGLKNPSSGKIIHRSKLVLSPSNQRVIIFQNYSLFPWKTAIQNIEFVLKSKKISESKIKSESLKYLRLVNLEKFKDNYPHELSGGMQQRIGIARALSCNPDVLLFDEPFASLDQITKSTIYKEILEISQKTKKTMIFVTHNIEEAIFLGDKIIVLSGCPGKIIKEIPINLVKGNNLSEIKLLPEFVKLETKILNLLN